MITNDLLVKGDLKVNGQIHGNYDSFIGIARGNPINIDSTIDYPFLSVTIYGKSILSTSSGTVTNINAGRGWHYSYSSTSGIGSSGSVSAGTDVNYILRGIPDLSDYITKDPERVYIDTSNNAMICDTIEWSIDGTRTIIRKLNQITILGTEQIVQIPTGTAGKSAWAIQVDNLARYADSDTTSPNVAVCKAISTVSVSDINNCTEGMSVLIDDNGNARAGWLLFYKEAYATMTVAEVRVALSSENIVVVYELGTYEVTNSDTDFILNDIGSVNGTCQLSHDGGYDLMVKYAKSMTLEQAIYYSEVGRTLREHIKNHPSGSGSGSSGNTGSGDSGTGGNGGTGGSTGTGSTGSGSNFVYQGSGIDVLDRIRIGGI